jgi:hypothetical protein
MIMGKTKSLTTPIADPDVPIMQSLTSFIKTWFPARQATRNKNEHFGDKS